MRLSIVAVLALAGVATAATFTMPPVWPIPQSSSIAGTATGSKVSDDFQFQTSLSSARLGRAAARYQDIININGTKGGSLGKCAVSVASDNETLSVETSYAYNVSISSDTCTVSAETIYGAMYGFETVAQLLESGAGPAKADVVDYPNYAHRGFMIDAGRRFFPMPLVLNLLDGMAANKLNVLHLHASDFCRFGVESKLYPELNAGLTGDQGGYYSQVDIGKMVAYAGDRGIRVVPEFDVPGHSHGLRALMDKGVQFCSKYELQMYDDPAGVSTTVIKDVLTEMAGLFPDADFHLGCDETTETGNCTLDNIRTFEQDVIAHMQSLGKRVIGWEELLFVSQAATPGVVINDWYHYNANESTAKGYPTIESNAHYFYFNNKFPTYKAWYDISGDLNDTQRTLMLGGEISMWSDNYCYIEQCWNDNGPKPVARALYPPGHDPAFTQSIGGMVWPRGHVAAAAFWNFVDAVDPQSDDFIAATAAQNDRVARRGVVVCPSNCTCDELTRCGVPYVPV